MECLVKLEAEVPWGHLYGCTSALENWEKAVVECNDLLTEEAARRTVTCFSIIAKRFCHNIELCSGLLMTARNLYQAGGGTCVFGHFYSFANA